MVTRRERATGRGETLVCLSHVNPKAVDTSQQRHTYIAFVIKTLTLSAIPYPLIIARRESINRSADESLKPLKIIEPSANEYHQYSMKFKYP